MAKLTLIKTDTQELLEIRNNSTIGREASNEIVFSSSYISKYHCKLTEKDGQWLLSDLHSTNGTFLNGEKLTRTTALRHGDTLMIGASAFTYYVQIEDSSETGGFKTTILENGVPLFSESAQESNSTNFSPIIQKKPIELLYILVPAMAGVFLLFLIITSIIGYWKNSTKENTTQRSSVLQDEYIPLGKTAILQNSDRTVKLPEPGKSLSIEDFIRSRLTDLGELPENVTTDMITRIIYYIELFRQGKTYFERMENRKKYIDIIEDELKKAHLNPCYSFIALVESGYLPEAYNKTSGAKGMWQFLPATAKEYGLTVNRWNDERTDPRKSTRAAAKYIADMCAVFGSDSFLLVTASFNCGDGRLRSALKETNALEGSHKEKRSFFYLYDQKLIPAETRDYVFKIVAAILLSEYLSAQGKTE